MDWNCLKMNSPNCEFKIHFSEGSEYEGIMIKDLIDFDNNID